MKINDVIRTKRLELGMTQEQVALRLGVSTPAVNKWERGASYPDITLIPVLARLLKTDANTLLSFQDDITAEQNLAIQRETDRLVREEGYDAGFRYAVDAMREYSACDQLACILTCILTGRCPFTGHPKAAARAARRCSSIMRFCDAPAWMSTTSFEVAAALRDAAACLGILEGMLQSIEGGSRVMAESVLYQGADMADVSDFAQHIADFVLRDLRTNGEIRLLEGRGSFRVPFRPRGVVERRSQLISHAREPHAFDRPCRFLPCVVEFLALRISSSKLDCLANIKH